MKFFDPFRYASPLRKALAKKENAPRNLRFETLENRALLSVTPLDELQAAVSSAEIAPAYTVETPVVDLSVLAVSNATTATDANDDQYEENDALADATPLGVLTETKIVEGIAAPRVNNVYENDYYSFATTYTGTGDHYIQLDVPEGFNVGFLTVSLSNAVNNTANNTFPSSVQVNGACKTISLAGVPAGDYAIQVYSGNAKGVYIPYTLTINPPKPKTDDVYEGQTGNNSIDAATDLGMIGPSTLEATVGPNANADFYKFTLVDDGTEADYLKLDYTETSNVLMNVTIYDQQKKPILTNVNEWTSNKIETFSLAGQKAGDYYVEIVTNQNVAGFSDYTLSIVAPTTAPAAPTNFDASGDKVETVDGTTLFLANEATLSWDAVAHITGYEVRYSSDDGKTWTTETLAPNQTSFDLTELAYATEYLCQVRAVRISDGFYDWNVASKWEDSALKFTTVDAPVAPELAQPELTLETFKPSEQKIALTWTNVAYERGYVVQTFDANGAWVDASERLAADTTTWTTDKLELDATYVYRVVAFNNAGETASAQITVVTPNVPTAPTGLTATVDASFQATLSWTASNQAGYRVELQTQNADGETVWTPLATLAADATTWTSDALASGATYQYRVVAFNDYGDGGAAETSVTLEAASTVVTTLADVVDPDDNLISLREAIQYAEAGDVVTFDNKYKGGTIQLHGTCLQIDKAITIDGSFETGAPQITVDADAKSRVFNVVAGTVDAPVKLVGLTITNGYADVVDNIRQYGGGIRVGANAALDVANSKIVGNRSTERGGGVYLNAGSTGNFTNVEITGNVGAFYGGGVAVAANASATFRNATVIGLSNLSNQVGIDVDANSGAVKFYNSIVQYVGARQETQTLEAYNTASDFTDWTNADEEGVVNYVIDETLPLFKDAANGDYALATGSQALEKGDVAWLADENGTPLVTTDLTGNARVVGTAADIGAYEHQNPLAPAAPGAITFGAYDKANEKVEMSWGNVDGETRYRVEYSFDGGADGTWYLSQVMKADQTTRVAKVDGHLATYYFRVRAENQYGVSEWTYSEAFTTAARPAPAAPGAITFGAYDKANEKVEMSWDNVKNATHYRVEYSFDQETWGLSQVVLNNSEGTETSRLALVSGYNITYYFRVRAENQYGVSEWSEVQEFTTPRLSKPGKPTFGAYNDATERVEMSWTPTPGAVRYRVEYRRPTAANEPKPEETQWQLAAIVGGDVVSRLAYISYGNSTYEFRVRAEDANGVSEWSDVGSFIAPALVVNTTLDDSTPNNGLLSLREAVAMANDGETITFADELKGETLTLTLGEIAIAPTEYQNQKGKQITIDASNLMNYALVDNPSNHSDPTGIKIDAGGENRAFNIAENSALTLKGVHVTNGSVGVDGSGYDENNPGDADYHGGAFHVLGTLNLVYCYVSNSSAYYAGGAVAVSGTLNAQSTIFVNNYAAQEFGGAIWSNGGNVTVDDCFFHQNVIAAGKSQNHGGGGAIAAEGGTLVSNASTYYENGAWFGGALFLSGATVYSVNDVLVHNGSDEGVSLQNRTGCYQGGAVNIHGGDVVFVNATIADNKANTAGGVYVNASESDDGIERDLNLTFVNTILAGNSADISENFSWFGGGSKTINAYNTLSSYTAWDNSGESGVTNYEYDSSKPLFADLESHDITLAADSQALDKGDLAKALEVLNVDSFPHDWLYNERVVDVDGDGSAVIDLGAFERGASRYYSYAQPTVDGVYDAETGEVELTWETDETETVANLMVRVEYQDGDAWKLAAMAKASENAVKFAPQTDTTTYRVRLERYHKTSDWVEVELTAANAEATSSSTLEADVFADFDEFDFFGDEDDLDALAKRLV